MFSLISIILGTFLIIFLYLHLQHERKFGHLRKIFPGCVWYISLRLVELSNPDNALEFAWKLKEKYKSTFLYLIYPTSKLILHDIKLIELILTTNMDKTVEYSYINSWLADGILTAKTDKWKMHKKFLAPAFSKTNLQQHICAFNKNSKILCEKLQENIDKSFNIHEYIQYCTLDIILNTGLGANINVQSNPTSEYMKNTSAMCDILFRRGLTFYKYYAFYYFSSLRKIEAKASKYLNEFSRKFITERRNAKSTSAIRTILDMVLDEDLTDEEICAEINTIIFAGHETTASTLSFCLYELSRNADIQSKVYKEIIDVIGEDNDPTYDDLENLSYTSLVLKEVSRMYPGVPIISRCLTKDITWNGHILPKGLECYVSIFHYQRDPDFYPEPEKFDPERFSDENFKNIPAGAYFPFSIAPRGCIGQKFAQLEMKVLLVYLLREFELMADWNFKVEVVTKVSLQSKNGVKLKLKKRNKFN